ncbi:hypothetical protein [Aliihoeflea sp. PC F10.4]
MSAPQKSPDAAARERAARSRRRRRNDAEFKRISREAGPRWKSALFGLCFVVPAGLIIVYASARIETMLETLRIREAVIDTSSEMFGIILVALSMTGIGILALLGAMRMAWAYHHAGAIFGGILACLLLGIGLMITGGEINAALMRYNGYEPCDRKSYYRMTTTLWALQERGCDGVDYTTWRPLR